MNRAYLFALLLLGGCPGCDAVQPDRPPLPHVCDDCMPPMPPAPAPQPDPEPPTPAPDACARAAANMASLGCDGWRGSPGEDERYGTADDVSAAQVCRDTEASALDGDGVVRWSLSAHPYCVASALNCEAAARCFEKPEPSP